MIPTSIDGTDITGATIDGTDVQEITVDGQTVFPAVQTIDVYLEDDFGDNALTNRTGSNTGAYNGVTGTFRPEYSTVAGTGFPSVSNQTLDVGRDENMTAPINLNFNQTITWEYTNHDPKSSGPNNAMALFGETTTMITGDSGLSGALQNGYALSIRNSGSSTFEVRFLKIDNNLSATVLINDDNVAFPVDITVTRSPSGTFELFTNGSSQGTVQDTTHTIANFVGFGGRDFSGGGFTMDSYKIF